MNTKERATMARRYEIDDVQWEKIKPYLGNTPKKTGRPQVDNRKLLNGVLWIMHTGAPWRDLPEYYGPWQTVYKRFSQWQKDEKLRQLFENVRENPDMQDLCIDGTYIKAHRSSAGTKKGLRNKKYLRSMDRWKDNWAAVSPMFKFSDIVRRGICATNAIERLNRFRD